MRHVVERPDTREVHLRALAVRGPVLAPLLDFLLELVVELVHLNNLHTLTLRAVDLPAHRLVPARVCVRRVDALLRDRDERGPAELLGQVLLRLAFNARPHRLEVRLVQEVEVRVADLRDLLLLAQRVAERDREAVHGHIANRGARVLIPPHGPCGIHP